MVRIMKNRDVESEAAGRKSNIETDKQNISFLYLSEEDMIDAGVLNPGRCVDVMEETMGLMEDGDFLMGGPYNDAHGLMLYFPKKSPIENFPVNNARDRRFIAMPAYLGGRFHVAGEKWFKWQQQSHRAPSFHTDDDAQRCGDRKTSGIYVRKSS